MDLATKSASWRERCTVIERARIYCINVPGFTDGGGEDESAVALAATYFEDVTPGRYAPYVLDQIDAVGKLGTEDLLGFSGGGVDVERDEGVQIELGHGHDRISLVDTVCQRKQHNIIKFR